MGVVIFHTCGFGYFLPLWVCFFLNLVGLVIWAIAPLKPTKVTLFTIILHNSKNNIHDIRTFRRSLFCHSSVVKYASSLVHYRSCYEIWLPNITEIAPPPTLLAGSTPACGFGYCSNGSSLRDVRMNILFCAWPTFPNGWDTWMHFILNEVHHTLWGIDKRRI